MMKLALVAMSVASAAAALAAPCTTTDLSPVTTYLAAQMSYSGCKKASGVNLVDFFTTTAVPAKDDVIAFQSSLDCKDLYDRFQAVLGPTCSLWGVNYADARVLSFNALTAIKANAALPSNAPNTTTLPVTVPVTTTPPVANVTTLPVTTKPATTKPSSGSMSGNMTEEPVITLAPTPVPTFATIKKVTPTPAPSSAVGVAVSAASLAVAAAHWML
ncbi:hypothetical protein SDRG_16025 [Saprolegnia diclina VS20]|uniref:Secreted protein n=1 Tax=Saprolegnia diclina (strain VS20) TaxID=1156394 RepID=T0PL72_SAPDV|nr:hypothetical protein SDRG_16025 [Saprolegnia diclina VS20]EQC26134.1 hypothetical protein SDRG_16025 [Saprolegnia diclina VS20]|eukprot:XP_008620436.1 hypothetical protein SDRG_16025 [Saprolegnia diclina VS20]